MSKVEFTYGRGGKKVMMASRTAEALRRLGHGEYVTKDVVTEAPAPQTAPLVSDALAAFAAENGVDLAAVTGTGKDGRVRKSDIEEAILAKDFV